MTITINGTTGITTPEVTLDNSTADGGQVVLKSSGYSNWNLDNYSGRFRGYYGSTEYFTVDASGNMGIGTSSPSAKLDLYNAGSQLQLKMTASGNGFAITNDPSYTLFQTANAVYMGFGTNGAERMRIDSNGSVMVNTTTVRGAFTVQGNSDVFAVYTATAGGAGYRYFTGVTTGYAAYFTTSGSATYAGSIYCNGSATSYATSSDYRLKENIAPMTGALTVVSQLKPVAYTWKTDGSAGQGFIAHELQEVVPDAVVGEKDAVDADGNPVYQGIDTSFLVATLTAAIQELKAELDATKAEVAALKGQQA